MTANDSPSPECSLLEGRRLLEQLAQALGPEILESLVTFILEPRPGSRLSLQRNQNDFTSQLTGPVVRSSSSPVELSDFRDLMRKIAPSE